MHAEPALRVGKVGSLGALSFKKQRPQTLQKCKIKITKTLL